MATRIERRNKSANNVWHYTQPIRMDSFTVCTKVSCEIYQKHLPLLLENLKEVICADDDIMELTTDLQVNPDKLIEKFNLKDITILRKKINL